MSRLWVLGAGTAPFALVLLACSGSSSHSGSPSAQGGSSGSGGAGAAGGEVALAGGGAAPASGGAAGGGHAGQATGGGVMPGAGESGGGNAAGGTGAMAGSSNVAGMPGSAGAQTDGGAGWIIPATPGAGWNGPQDPACPSATVSRNAECASPPGTRCSYPESDGTYTLRCQCYTSSTGGNLWWCQEHASIGYDLCPVSYTGNGSCPTIGDVTCYYVADDKLQACNCSAGTVKCSKWGL